MVKVLFIIIIGSFYCKTFCQQFEDVNIIEVEFRICRDTVRISENIEIELIFKNISYETVCFCPESIIFLRHNSDYFIGSDNYKSQIYFLNDNVNPYDLVTINPSNSIPKTYYITINDVFFHIGKNDLIAVNAFKEKRTRRLLINKTKRHNESKCLEGYLISNSNELIVIK